MVVVTTVCPQGETQMTLASLGDSPRPVGRSGPGSSQITAFCPGSLSIWDFCVCQKQQNKNKTTTIKNNNKSVIVQSLNCANSEASWTAAHQASLSFTVSRSLLKLMSIELMMPSRHLIPCYPLLLLPSSFLRVFSSELALYIRWPKYWNFSFSISPFSEYSGLVSLLSKGLSRVFSNTKV